LAAESRRLCQTEISDRGCFVGPICQQSVAVAMWRQLSERRRLPSRALNHIRDDFVGLLGELDAGLRHATGSLAAMHVDLLVALLRE
jgi:hypothetical protein